MKKIYKVKGMTCKHCAKAVETAISDIKTVSSVKVLGDLKSVEVEFAGADDDNAVEAAVTEIGFELEA